MATEIIMTENERKTWNQNIRRLILIYDPEISQFFGFESKEEFWVLSTKEVMNMLTPAGSRSAFRGGEGPVC